MTEFKPSWRKSSRSSAGNAGTCVEAADLRDNHKGLADSKDKRVNRPFLSVDDSTFAGFIGAIKRGEFS